jgi:predicted nucleic acid-binding protein
VLVLDANIVVVACGADDGFAPFTGEELVAPRLLWSEARSALHEGMWRGEVSRSQTMLALERMESMPVTPRNPRRLAGEAWRIADELGWAKTYDAEYVALARLMDCRLVTLDRRLHRGAARLGIVVRPEEMHG